MILMFPARYFASASNHKNNTGNWQRMALQLARLANRPLTRRSSHLGVLREASMAGSLTTPVIGAMGQSRVAGTVNRPWLAF